MRCLSRYTSRLWVRQPVFVVDNDTSGIYRVISVDELNLLTGIDVYPSLPQEIKSTVTVFPVFGNK